MTVHPQAAEVLARNTIANAVAARFGWMPLSTRYAAADAALTVGREWAAGHRAYLLEHLNSDDEFVRDECRRQLAELDATGWDVTT